MEKNILTANRRKEYMEIYRSASKPVRNILKNKYVLDRHIIICELVRNYKKILVVGTGIGFLERLIGTLPNIEQVVSIDAIRFKKFQKSNNKKIKYRILDMLDLDKHYKKNEFECTVCSEVLEHVPIKLFDKCLRNLRLVTKGKLIITMPFEEKFPLYGQREPHFDPNKYFGHKQSFDLKKIKKIFPKSKISYMKRNSRNHTWVVITE